MDSVSVILLDNEFWGEALLRFENDGNYSYVYNPSYSDSTLYHAMDRKVKGREVLEVDYQPLIPWRNSDCPFFFKIALMTYTK